MEEGVRIRSHQELGGERTDGVASKYITKPPRFKEHRLAQVQYIVRTATKPGEARPRPLLSQMAFDFRSRRPRPGSRSKEVTKYR